MKNPFHSITLLFVSASALLGAEAGYSQWEAAKIPNSIFVNAFAEQKGVLFAAGQPAYTYDTAGHIIHPYPSVFRSDDSGLTWSPSDSGVRGLTVDAMVSSDSILLIGTYTYNVFRSSDGGKSWKQADSVENWQNTEWVNSFTSHGKYLFATAENGQNGSTIIRSSDMGRTWQSTPGIRGLRTLLTEHNGRIIASGENGLGRSSDDGDTWDYSVTWIQRPSALVASDSFAFISCQTGTYRAWDTACNYWQKLTDWTGNGLATDGPSNLFTSTYNYPETDSVYRSVDNGITWSNISNGLSGVTVNALFVANGYLFIGGDRYPPIWRRPLSGFASATDPPRLSSSIKIEQNYPNPFAYSTILGFTIPTSSFVTLTVVDCTGRETRLFSGVADAGQHECPWDASHFPSGVYTVRLNSGSVSTSREIVLLR